MSEQQEHQPTIDKDELGKEATDTINTFKDTLKQVDLKKDTLETKGFFLEMFKDPISKIREIANAEGSTYFKTSIILMIIWTAVIVVTGLFNTLRGSGVIYYFSGIVENFLYLLKLFLKPVLGVIVWSLIVFIFSKSGRKSLISNINVIVAAKFPVIIAAVANSLTMLSYNASTILSPFSSFCTVISNVLLYFGLKALVAEDTDNSSYLKKFAVMTGVFYLISFALSFLGIYI